jgi:hypothetical protein
MIKTWEKRFIAKSNRGINTRNDCLLDEITELRKQHEQDMALLLEMYECPYVLDEATIPKAGIEAAPDQVVGTLHVALQRMRKLKARLEKE